MARNVTPEQLSEYITQLNRGHRNRFEHFRVGLQIKIRQFAGEVIEGIITHMDDMGITIDNGIHATGGAQQDIIAWSEILSEEI